MARRSAVYRPHPGHRWQSSRLAEAANELTTISADRAVPGHGPVSVSWPAAEEPEQRYLEAVAHDTRAAIKSGIGIANAYRQVANSERGKWLLFDEYHPRNVTASYKELEWE